MVRIEYVNFVEEDFKVVKLEARGHPSDVIEVCRNLVAMILGNHGAWRFTAIVGTISPDTVFESDMKFILRAEVKK